MRRARGICMPARILGKLMLSKAPYWQATCLVPDRIWNINKVILDHAVLLSPTKQIGFNANA